jgi:hypothetical protein
MVLVLATAGGEQRTSEAEEQVMEFRHKQR